MFNLFFNHVKIQTLARAPPHRQAGKAHRVGASAVKRTDAHASFGGNCVPRDGCVCVCGRYARQFTVRADTHALFAQPGGEASKREGASGSLQGAGESGLQ